MLNSSTVMASATFNPTSSLSSSSATSRKLSLRAFSNSAILIPQNVNFKHLNCIRQLGFTLFSPWNGLKHLGISISYHYVKIERKGKFKGKGVYASLFGVGAPEVLVIGVVALLVFGPKGLAEVARNLGKTLRAFLPTIRELQEVSREFKSTLEREIGLDEIDNSAQKSPPSDAKSEDSELKVEPNGSPSQSEEASRDSLKIKESQLLKSLALLRKDQAVESQAALEMPPTDRPKNDTVEETAPAESSIQEVESAGVPLPKSENNASREVASAVATPSMSEGNAPQEVASAVASPSKPENET